MTLAHYYFVPTVREGLAAYVTQRGTERAEIQASVIPYVNGAAEAATDNQCATTPAVYSKTVALYGPGDVLGFDASVVSRTDPRPHVLDYEPNYMPLVEFSEPDLPWRFTPSVADPGDSGKLPPWLTLIVLQAGEYSGLGERLPPEDPSKKKGALPIRWINQVRADRLPDLGYAWLWAHVHVTSHDSLLSSDAESSPREILARSIAADPQDVESHVAARLVCPRRLAPQTQYTAFVVPTFKLGLVATGFASSADLSAELGALTPAWTNTDSKIDLPYYFKFDFGTSVRADFESLVRLLEPRALTDLGRRSMDCSAHLYNIVCPGDVEPHLLRLEGALISPDLQPGTWHNDTSTVERDSYQQALADLLNGPVTLLESGSNTPPVVPPVFGRRHSGRPAVDPTKLSRWQDDVNLDPRERAAAGFGALIVQKEQEALMAGVWEQLGDIDQANELVRNAQLGLEGSKATYKRLGLLGLADFLWTAAPIFPRVRAQVSTAPSPTTVANYVAASPIPSAAFDTAFRRVLRSRGGPRKRQKVVPLPPAGQDLLSRLNRGEIAAAGAVPKPAGMPSMCDLTEAAIARLEKLGEPARRSGGVFRINGRVIDARNRRGLGGLRVEAWDKDPFFSDVVGGATTDDRGSFRIDFDVSYFKEWFLDRRPDLFFKVFRGARPVKVTEPSVLRNVRPGDLTQVIAVEPPIAPERLADFRISGQVIDRTTHHGVPYVRVEAWDKDPFINDLVGGAVTDEQGRFRVEFERSHFTEWFLDPRPDLFFKVFNRDRLLTSTEHAVMSNVPPGETSVSVVVDAPSPPAHPPGLPGVADFCEAAITCQALTDVTSGSGTPTLWRDIANSVCAALGDWLAVTDAPVAQPVAADLVAVHDIVKAAIAPWVTIPARIATRLRLGPGVHQRGILGRLESEVDFPQAMYEPLAAISQNLILPGVETVPQNTISILKANRRFIEAYMLGLNDSLASEALWRGAPVYLWTSFFRQFWSINGVVDPAADPNLSKDITRISTWKVESELGQHDPRLVGAGPATDTAVLLIRGDLLKRYPHSSVYAVEAIDESTPALKEYAGVSNEIRVWPIFSGSLAPDLTFLGLPLTPLELCTGGSHNQGHFIVIEEHIGEPRFGFDLPDNTTPKPHTDSWWFDLTWASLEAPPVAENDYVNNSSVPSPSLHADPVWQASSAAVANICLQRPVRVCIHANQMLSEGLCHPPATPVEE